MSETNSLVLDTLQSVEEIKALKHKYFRALDRELFEEVGSCFVSDCLIDYGAAGVYEGVEGFVAMISDYAKTNTARGVHQGYNPEIAVDGDSATGIWLCTYISVDTEKGVSYKQTGYYEDEYIRENGEWKIKVTKNTPQFSETAMVENDNISLTLG